MIRSVRIAASPPSCVASGSRSRDARNRHSSTALTRAGTKLLMVAAMPISMADPVFFGTLNGTLPQVQWWHVRQTSRSSCLHLVATELSPFHSEGISESRLVTHARWKFESSLKPASGPCARAHPVGWPLYGHL